jgi:large subunit ribosomal protein L17
MFVQYSIFIVGTLHARRQALAIVTDKSVVKKLFDEFPQRFADRTGGSYR